MQKPEHLYELEWCPGGRTKANPFFIFPSKISSIACKFPPTE